MEERVKMAKRKIRSDCKIGTLENKIGLPAGSFRHTNGRDVRSDMKVKTLREQVKRGTY